MRFVLLITVFGIVAVSFETTWFSSLVSSSLSLDFALVCVAAIAFTLEWKQGAPGVVALGLLMDVGSFAPFGMSVFSYLLIYGFIRTIISKISFQSGPALIVWVAFMSMMDKAICAFILLASSGQTELPHLFLRAAPAQALIDAVVALAAVPFLHWYWDLSWEKMTRPRGIVVQ